MTDYKKKWFVKDGTIGTAHTGRDGNLKDFREGRIDLMYISDYKIKFHPQDGVKAQDLIIFLERENYVLGTIADWNWKHGEHLPATGIKFSFRGETILLKLEPRYWCQSWTFSYEAKVLYEKHLKEREERRIEEDKKYQERKNQQKQNADSFEESLKSYQFTKQEKRWLRRFRDFGKAYEESFQTMKKIPYWDDWRNQNYYYCDQNVRLIKILKEVEL